VKIEFPEFKMKVVMLEFPDCSDLVARLRPKIAMSTFVIFSN